MDLGINFITSGVIASILYLTAAVGLGQLLRKGVSCFDNPRTWIKIVGAAGLIFHGYVIYVLVIEQWVNLGFFHALSIAGWLLVLLLEMTWLLRHVGNLGIIIFPIAAATVIMQSLNPDATIQSASSELDTHIFISMLAYSLLGVAAIQAMLLAVQERHLRNKKPGGFIRALPPMNEVENLMFQLIRGGVIVLGLALISAIPLVDNILEQQRAHTAVLSVISLLIFSALLWGRARHGWRGKVASYWTLSGFGFLFFAYLGSRFVIEILLETAAVS